MRCGRLVSSVRQSLPPDVDKWGVSLQLLMGAVVAGGFMVTACYRWMQDNVITDTDCVDVDRYAQCSKTVFCFSFVVVYLPVYCTCGRFFFNVSNSFGSQLFVQGLLYFHTGVAFLTV